MTEPAEIERLKGQQALKSKRAKAAKAAEAGQTGASKNGDADVEQARSDNPLKISIGLHKISKATKAGKSVMKGTSPSNGTVVKKVGAEGQSKIMKIKIDRKKIEKGNEEAAAKRRRVQYGDDADYTPRKQSRTLHHSNTSKCSVFVWEPGRERVIRA